jgi:6-phosphogluconate dehydrogenase
LKDERVRASKVLPVSAKKSSELIKDKKVFLEQVRKALYASKICSYAQGFMLLAAASKEFNWNLNMGAISLMWRGGCIIRSRFLGDIKKAFEKNPQLTNLLLDDFFLKSITECLVSLVRKHKNKLNIFRKAGVKLLPLLFNSASQHLHSALLFHSTIVTAARSCQQT